MAREVISGIYKITNLVNGMIYIGQSKDIYARWTEHKIVMNKKDTKLYRAMREYGVDNFSFEIVERCSVEQLNERERYYIQEYNAIEKGYNMKVIDNLQYKMTPEEIEEIREDLKDLNLLMKDIAAKHNVSHSLVCQINTGDMWYDDSISYPIRPKGYVVKKENDSHKEKICGIYRITNLIDGRSYIGQSIDIYKRWKAHRIISNNNATLGADIKKYGIKSFYFEILDICKPEELNKMQEFFIKRYNTIEYGYNAKINAVPRLELQQENNSITESKIKSSGKENYCIDCGKKIYKGSTRCVDCYNALRTKAYARFTREELKDLIRTKPFAEICRMYGMTNNALRKWCKKYGLPNRVQDIKEYSDEEWKDV